MKKYIAIILALISIMVLASCEKKETNKQDDISKVPASEMTVSKDEDFRGEVVGDGVYISDYRGDAQIVNIPEFIDGLPVIGVRHGLNQNDNMVEVNFSSSIKEIDRGVFNSHNNLKKVNLNEGLEIIGHNAFVNCTKLEEINIPSTVKIIEDGAFCTCISLKSIEIPDGVEEIGPTAFGGTGVDTLKFGEKLQMLENNLCNECPNLKDVYIMNPDIVIDVSAFAESPNVVIHAAAGSTAEQFAAENDIPFIAE